MLALSLSLSSPSEIIIFHVLPTTLYPSKKKQTNKKTVFPFFLKHSTVVISALRTFGRWWWLRSSTPPLYFSALEMYSYIYIPPLHFDSVLVLPREEKPVIKTKASVSFLRKFVTVVEELHSNFIPMRVCPPVMEHNVWPFGHHELDCFNIHRVIGTLPFGTPLKWVQRLRRPFNWYRMVKASFSFSSPPPKKDKILFLLKNERSPLRFPLGRWMVLAG